jgi:COP9 signalosome complex subunit 1
VSLLLLLLLMQVISSADVALYGGLTALASFDRSELRSQVINNIGFREFMELYPEVRLRQN